MLPSLALSEIRDIGFVLIDGFSILPLAGAIEVLDCANSVLDRREFSYSLLSIDGSNKRASGTSRLGFPTVYAAGKRCDAFFLCGNSEHLTADEQLVRWVSAQAPNAVLGAVGSATSCLLRAGLLNGYWCATRSEQIDDLSQQYPMVKFTTDRAAIDRDRLTCANFSGVIDLAFEIIRAALDIEVVWQVSKILDLGHVYRPAIESENKLSQAQMLSDAITIMKANVEIPISPALISESIGVSIRGLQRLFQDALNTSPSKYYLRMRLERGRELLIRTRSSVTEISYNCGFQSSAHFARCYRTLFGRTPREERRSYRQSASIGEYRNRMSDI